MIYSEPKSVLDRAKLREMVPKSYGSEDITRRQNCDLRQGKAASVNATTLAAQPNSSAFVLDKLAEVSKRPRYAYIVLQLLVEAAGSSRKAGPFVQEQGSLTSLREWLARRLAAISGRRAGRSTLQSKIRKELADAGRLPDDLLDAQNLIDAHVEDRILQTGSDNVSRVLHDLEKCGFIERSYVGFRTDHSHRGGWRLLACEINAEVAIAFRRQMLI